MIVLKILLWILLAIIGLLILVCVIPAGGEFSYLDGKLKYKAKLGCLNVMDSEGGGILGWLKKRKAKKKVKKKKKKDKDEPETALAAAEEAPLAEETPPETPEAAADESPSDSSEAPEAETVSADELTEEEIDAIENISGDEKPPEDKKEKKKKKKDKKKKKKDDDETYFEFDDDDDDEDEDDEPKKSLGDKLGKLLDIWRSAKRPLNVIFKGFKFSEVYIDFDLANEDACDCAVNYGRLSAVIFNGIRLFSELFTVRFKTVDVRPKFGEKDSRWDASGRLKFRLGTAVIAGVWFLVTYIFRIVIPKKLKARKAKKAAAAQK